MRLSHSLWRIAPPIEAASLFTTLSAVSAAHVVESAGVQLCLHRLVKHLHHEPSV